MSFQVSSSVHSKVSDKSQGRTENWGSCCGGETLKSDFSSNSWSSSETDGGLYCGEGMGCECSDRTRVRPRLSGEPPLITYICCGAGSDLIFWGK